MALTNGDILDYILANRLFLEDGEYLLQEKIDTMGRDAVGSARAWLFGRFLQAGETTTFQEFIDETYDNLIPANLTEIEDIRAAYFVLTGDKDTTNVYVMLFEALVRLAIAYIWEAARMDGQASIVEKGAQELISAIVGASANPDNVIGGDEGGGGTMPLVPSVNVYALTDDEVSAMLGGYE